MLNPDPWVEMMGELTPIEELGGMLFKREDKFAPLGLGGINGSKCRQRIWVVQEYIKKGGAGAVIAAASVKSPQLSTAAVIAQHYGLDSLSISGATNPKSAFRHDSVRIASWFGSRFRILKVAYNPALQRGALDLFTERGEKDFIMEYGSPSIERNGVEYLTKFQDLGASQVENLPSCKNLIVPVGSGNTIVSVLMGLARFKPRIETIHLVVIGPPKFDKIQKNLKLVCDQAGLDSSLFDFSGESKALYNLEIHDLFGAGLIEYGKELRYSYAGLDLHPTYESKVFKYLVQSRPDLLGPGSDSTFWMVGGPMYLWALQPYVEASRLSINQVEEYTG